MEKISNNIIMNQWKPDGSLGKYLSFFVSIVTHLIENTPGLNNRFSKFQESINSKPLMVYLLMYTIIIVIMHSLSIDEILHS